MAYDSWINRTDAAALIPEEVCEEIFRGVTHESACLSMFTRLPNMSRRQARLPVLSALPSAFFVDGDSGLKQTTEQAWANKYIYAEEIACIVPIPEAVLEDADYDIWGQVKPRIQEAFGKVIDAAILFGTNKPALWPDGIVTAAVAAGNAVALGTGADLYDDMLGENGHIAKLEAAGYMATGHIAAMSMRGKLRALRSLDGEPLFKATMQEGTHYQLDGEEIIFPQNGAFNPSLALMVSGQMDQAVYSIRQEMTWKVLDQAVLTNSAGEIIYNLAQQDMVALRAVMRLGWQVPNPVNQIEQNEAARYPFAVLTPAG